MTVDEECALFESVSDSEKLSYFRKSREQYHLMHSNSMALAECAERYRQVATKRIDELMSHLRLLNTHLEYLVGPLKGRGADT